MKMDADKLAVEMEGIKNLLIINLMHDGVDPKVISEATNIPEGTLRRKYPMKLIKGD